MGGQCFLQVERGPEVGRRFPLRVGETTIGRESGNALILTDIKISRQHILIALSASGDLRVRDLDSFNGTKVNGQPIAGPQRLRPGDTIEIGDTLLRLVDHPPQP